MKLLPGKRELAPRQATIINPPDKPRRIGPALALLIFLAVGLALSWGAVTTPRPAAIVTTPAVSDYVLTQDGRVELENRLNELRGERAAIDASIEAINAEWVRANADRQDQLLTQRLELETDRDRLNLQIEQTRADIQAERERASVAATAEAQKLAVHAQATAAAVENLEREAAAMRQVGQARAAVVAYFMAAIAAGIFFLSGSAAAALLVWDRARARRRRSHRPNTVDITDLMDEFIAAAERGRPPTGAPRREPPRTTQNRSGTVPVPEENRSRTVLEEPAEKLDGSRPPSAGERAMIRAWYNRLHSMSAVCRTLYGYKNDTVWHYVRGAIEEGEGR